MRQIIFLISILISINLYAQNIDSLYKVPNQEINFKVLNSVIDSLGDDLLINNRFQELSIASLESEKFNLFAAYSNQKREDNNILEYTFSINTNNDVYAESYLKGEGWEVSKFSKKNALVSVTPDEIFKFNAEGNLIKYGNSKWQVEYGFYSEGNVRSMKLVNLSDRKHYTIYFFSNGKQALRFETKRGKYYNIIEAFDMNGNKIDAGNLTEGEGTINYYNECIEEVEEIKILKGKTSNDKISVFNCNM